MMEVKSLLVYMLANTKSSKVLEYSQLARDVNHPFSVTSARNI